MTNRLPYETIGGNLSPEITFAQLIEYLTLIHEDAHKLANLTSTRPATSAGWRAIANNFDKIITVVTHLAKAKTSSSTGFRA